MNDSLDFKKRSLINSMKHNFPEQYKKNFSGKEFHFYPFAAYCHAYAEYLLNSSDYNEYGNFIKEFNSIIVQDEIYLWAEKVQTRSPGVMSIFSYNYMTAEIIDKRYRIKGEEFSNEIDLEILILSNFQDYFREEIEIKRQQVVGYGKSDLLINGNIVIELKKSTAKRKDVYQAFEYSFGEDVEVTCLIAQGFSEEVLDIANKLKVECYRYAFGRDPEQPGIIQSGYSSKKYLKLLSISSMKSWRKLIIQFFFLITIRDSTLMKSLKRKKKR
ncbi:hypothetical protein [Planococcus faecalis]|uniref:hypothetical protein n=1 Tax=Planococcus faecalis TaxID=1598147 RepID=UPI0008D8E855|nr:hypothetical protein [Planococcus faecalis]OHX52043.1 hypothetical protein BB777_14010 [Planococcus faecalis]